MNTIDDRSDNTGIDLAGMRQRADAQFHYDLNNPYTSQQEKLEIECWFQLPMDVSGHAYAVCVVLWALGRLTGWQAYWVASGLGALVSLIAWVAYSPRIIRYAALTARAPILGIIIHLGIIVWLGLQHNWSPMALLILNTITSNGPTGTPAIILNKILTIRHRLHMKYALLKIKYGKMYEFECRP